MTTFVAELFTTEPTAALTTTTTTETPIRSKLTLRSNIPAVPPGRVGIALYRPTVFEFEVSPNEVNLQRLTLTYAELERPGRKPLLQAKAKQLQQVSFTALVTSTGVDRFFSSCQDRIDLLLLLARSDSDITISYPGVPADIVWRMSDLTLKVVRRNSSNEITIAEVDMTFTETTSPQAVVPGMPLIKDIPPPRNTRGGGSNPGATSDCQRAANEAGLTGRDSDTYCSVAVVIEAGGQRVEL